MVGDQSKPQASTAPPRTLNVQKFAESRASELKALHSIVSSRLNNDFRWQRNKRRRTTGHHDKKKRFRKKQKVGQGNNSDGLLENDQKKVVPRRIRRRLELKKNLVSGFSASGDGTKRLPTHVWHAKRFTMSKLWGFYLPLGLHGRGKGSRAILKKLSQGALVHDASYYGAVKLDGPEDLLLSILSTVMVPSPLGNLDDTSQNILLGVTYGNAMLHHVGPLFAQAVAPVIYMWRPQHSNFDSSIDNTDTFDEQQSSNSYASSRQLWVWIHPAAFREGFDVLKSACERMNLNQRTVSCISLEGKLAKLDLIGLRAFQLIQKILYPVTCISTNSWALQKCSFVVDHGKTLLKNSSIIPHEDQISTSAIISLMVNDPHAFSGKGISVGSEAKPSEVIGAKETDIQGHTTLEGIPQWNTDSSSSLFLKPEEKSQFSAFVDLWDAHKGIIPPVQESFLCKEKHHQLMKIFSISDENCRNVNASGEQQSSQLCPILLLKDNSHRGFSTRWSIILPLSWVKAFWTALVSNGAQAIGLRERHWIACEAGLPYFPSDFPESNAYSCLMSMEEAITDQKLKLRPLAMTSLRIPTLIPWDCIQCASEKRSTTEVPEILPVCDNSVNILNCEKCVKSAVGVRGALFSGFVARTSNVLVHFLSHVNDDLLLLFPNLLEGKRCLPKVMKDEEMINQQMNSFGCQIMCHQKRCFIRVLLHAFKEGVFEEGAVVSAPQAADITTWSTRSEDDGGKFQVPQSLLGSFIVQQPSGRWELQVPDDPVAKEYFRWPIGFVTTGFVRGSKKPVAIALCEAVLLARLREEQWKTISKDKRRGGIYVLVRNLRSTAYRLALATIVLETREEDVDCM